MHWQSAAVAGMAMEVLGTAIVASPGDARQMHTGAAEHSFRTSEALVGVPRLKEPLAQVITGAPMLSLHLESHHTLGLVPAEPSTSSSGSATPDQWQRLLRTWAQALKL